MTKDDFRAWMRRIANGGQVAKWYWDIYGSWSLIEETKEHDPHVAQMLADRRKSLDEHDERIRAYVRGRMDKP